MNRKLTLLLNVSKLIWFKEIIVISSLMSYVSYLDDYYSKYINCCRKFAIEENYNILVS